MQIHEITKRQRTDEGLLDNFKQAAGITPAPVVTRTNPKRTALNPKDETLAQQYARQAKENPALACLLYTSDAADE